MKISYRFSFLTAIILMCSSLSFAQWIWQNPVPFGHVIYDVAFFDSNNGIGVGANAIIYTTDGGITWTDQPNSFTLYCITITDVNTAVAVGYNGVILKTTDAGANWTQQTSGVTFALRGVDFIDANNGTAVGYTTDGNILRTTDGGTTWTTQLTPSVRYLLSIYYYNADSAWACGEYGTIMRTTNGGTNWTVLNYGNKVFTDVYFSDSNNGTIVGYSGYIVRTTNGGTNWNIQTSGTTTPFKGVHFFDALNIMAVGESGKIATTTNAGINWTLITTDINQHHEKTFFTSPTTGVIVGYNGNILRTTDAGLNWTNLTSTVTTNSLNGVCFSNNSTGTTVGNAGTILRTTNGGTNWTPQTSGVTVRLNWVLFTDANTGTTVGATGTILRTTDGGTSWTPQTSGVTDELKSVSFTDVNTGTTVGSSTILRTTDGGTTWTPQTSGVTTALNSVSFTDANTGTIVGSSGTILRTTDGGTTWIPQTSGTTQELTGVSFSNANTGTAVGYGATILRTTDGGTTWTPQTSGSTNTFSGVTFYDANNGIIVGNSGTILRTADGGATWLTEGYLVYATSCVSFINADCAVVVGSVGTILRRESIAATTFQLSVNVAAGWNMVSIPGLHPVDQNVLTWWPGKDPSAGVFKFAAGYQAVTAAVPGTGYWMKNLITQTYNTGDEWPAGGIQFTAHDPINANEGWNLFGGYDEAVPAEGLSTTPPGLITGSVFKYQGGYQAADTIAPGYGYWVKLTGAGQINIVPSAGSGAGVLKNETEGFGKIIITDKSGKSYTLYAASGPGKSNQNFELPPPPPAGMFDIRYSTGRYAEDLSTDKCIELTGVQYPVKVKAEAVGIILSDESGRELARLAPGEEAVLKDLVNKLYILESSAPLIYSLEQNYPNPFNPVTSIQFSIAEDVSNLKLNIYNVIGEKVAQLVNGSLKAGIYRLSWDASEAASGTYIYQIVTDNFISAKKMVLLK